MDRYKFNNSNNNNNNNNLTNTNQNNQNNQNNANIQNITNNSNNSNNLNANQNNQNNQNNTNQNYPNISPNQNPNNFNSKSNFSKYYSYRSPYMSPPHSHSPISPPHSPYLYNSPPPLTPTQHPYFFDYDQVPPYHHHHHPYYSPKYGRTPPPLPQPPNYYNQNYIDYFQSVNYPNNDLIPQPPPPPNIHMYYQNVPNSPPPPLPFYPPNIYHDKYQIDPNFEYHQNFPNISNQQQNLPIQSNSNSLNNNNSNNNTNNNNNNNQISNQNNNNGNNNNINNNNNNTANGLKPIQPYQVIKNENQCNIGIRCILCSRGSPELLNSQTWSNIMRIVLYVLHECCNDQSNSNFFNLKKDVYKFMVCHWHLICSEKNKNENWHKQIQDILSHSKELFESGMEKFQQNGFWKLRDLTDPWTIQKPFSNRGGKRQSKTSPKISVKEIIENHSNDNNQNSNSQNSSNNSNTSNNSYNGNNNQNGNGNNEWSSLLKGFNEFKPKPALIPPKSPDSLSKGI